MTNMIISRKKGRCLELTIDNQEHDNAMSDEMAAELTRCLLHTEEDTDLIVLSGAGGDFCTGRLSMGKREGERPEALARRRKTEVIFRCYDAFRASTVPVIGLIRGRAYGFGCAIAALCDVTIAADTARFQIPEMAHSILPTMVMSALIDRVPRKALMHLVYSTNEINATKAENFGLVSAVVEEDRIDAVVEALIVTMLNAPRPALLGIKEYLRSAPSMDIRGAIDFAQNLHATVNSSSEMNKSKH
jgi:enoyl-CoA hydratase